jgi:hypothetical protein
VEPKFTSDRFPGIAARRRMRRSAWRPLLVSARLINCVAFNPSPVTSLVHLVIHPVVMTHAHAVCHSPPHCLARTLSRSTRSHTVSPYLVLTLGHVRPRTSCHMVHGIFGIFLCQRLTPFRFIPHASDCVSRDRTTLRPAYRH